MGPILGRLAVTDHEISKTHPALGYAARNGGLGAFSLLPGTEKDPPFCFSRRLGRGTDIANSIDTILGLDDQRWREGAFRIGCAGYSTDEKLISSRIPSGFESVILTRTWYLHGAYRIGSTLQP
jgi:hypothetical protein